MNRTLRVVAGLVGAALVAAGCGGGGSESGGGEDGGGTAAASPPDDLTVVTSFSVDNLVPLENGQWAPELGFGDLLMRPLPGGELEPWALESLQAADDTRWQLTLRDDVAFQNGNPLDADVLAELMTWHLANNERVPALLEGATAEATGPLTVELETAEPVPSVPSILASEGTFVLFDLATYRQHEDDPDGLADAGLYTGPYEVQSLTSGAMQLAPAAGYYGGEPPLSALTVRFVPEADARVRAVRSGEADLALYPPTAAARQLDGRSDAFYLTQPEGEATVGLQLFVNQAGTPLAEPEVRRAVQLATDYAALADDVMEGLYDPAVGLYPASLPYAVESLAVDPDRAEDLLDDAGWVREGDAGTRTKDGEELRLRLLTYPQQPDIGVVAVAMEEQLEAVGVDVEIVEVDDVYDTMGSPDGWELGISNEHAADLTATDPLRPLLNFYRSDGIWNFGGVDDPELDGLIDQLSTEPDEDARHELLADIQRLVVEDQAYGWFVAMKRTPVVAGPELRDYPIPVANLWLSPYSPQP